MRRQLGLARVVGRQRGRELRDPLGGLEGEVRGRRADELCQLVLGGEVVDVLVHRHRRGGYQPSPGCG